MEQTQKPSKLKLLTEDNFWEEFHKVHGGEISTNVGSVEVNTEEDQS